MAREIQPRPLVVRFSDFKTNEYRELEGGEKYEDVESNPMIGWRGVSRYISPEYEKAFRMEVKAIKTGQGGAGADTTSGSCSPSSGRPGRSRGA